MTKFTATTKTGETISFESKSAWTHVVIGVRTDKFDPNVKGNMFETAQPNRHFLSSTHKSERAALNNIKGDRTKRWTREADLVSEYYVVELATA